VLSNTNVFYQLPREVAFSSFYFCLSLASVIFVLLFLHQRYGYLSIDERFIKGQIIDQKIQLIYANLMLLDRELQFDISQIKQIKFRPAGYRSSGCSLIIWRCSKMLLSPVSRD